MNSTTARHLLLLALVLATLALTGCASYETRQPAADHGTVTVSWIFGQSFPDDRCGEAIRVGPGVYIIRMKGKPPTFNDPGTCLFHEMLHVMGGSHQ